MHTNNNIYQIKNIANGMLSHDVYRKIYFSSCYAKLGNFVEVGTAHGAATIALALGIKHSGSQGKIFTFEKIFGGSREQYGGINENLEIIKQNFSYFGVESYIELIIGDAEECYTTLEMNCEYISRLISLLMLDADGAIDRDFFLFYNKILPGSPIIIDDCNNFVKIQHLSNRSIKIDLKHKLTHILIQFFIDQGLIEKIEIIDNTFFGIKPYNMDTIVYFNKFHICRLYRSLIFNSGDLPNMKSGFDT